MLNHLDFKTRLWATVKAAGGTCGILGASIGSTVIVMHDTYVEMIDLEDTRYGVGTARYPLTDVEVLEKMVRHTKDFDAFRRGNPSLLGVEEFWQGRS